MTTAESLTVTAGCWWRGQLTVRAGWRHSSEKDVSVSREWRAGHRQVRMSGSEPGRVTVREWPGGDMKGDEVIDREMTV